MNKPQIDKILHKNQLFGAFEPAARNRIQAHMRPVDLKLGRLFAKQAAFSNTSIFRRVAFFRF